MKSQDRHTLDSEFIDNQINMRNLVIESTLGAIRSKSGVLYSLGSTAWALATYLSYKSPGSSEFCQALRLASQAYCAIFVVSTQTEGSVEVQLQDDLISIPATGITSYTHPGNWRSAFYLAVICRNVSGLDTLCTFPMDALRQSSSKADTFLYSLVEALRELWLGKTSVDETLLSALNETDSKKYQIGSDDFVLNIIVPEIDLFYRLLLRNEGEFNVALEKAMDCHRKYWTRNKDRKLDPHGFLAIGPLAYASMAHDAGMAVQIQSEYLPMYLLRGDCAKNASRICS